MSKKVLLTLFTLLMATVLVACGTSSGDGDGPIVLGFVPSTDSDRIADSIEPLVERLEEELGRDVEGRVMTNFSGLVEAMGNDQVHIGFIPAFGYVQVTERYDQVEVFAKSIRHGESTYRAQYTVRADSGIESLEDLEGKIWAFADQGSTSGYLFPAAQFMDDYGVTDLDSYFGGQIQAGSHDASLITVLEGDADFATTFEDARTNIVEDYPEAMDELVQLDFTDAIPNDTISANTNLLSEEEIEEIKSIFLSFNEDEEMIAVMDEVYNWTGLDEASHDEYEIVRSVYKKFQEQFD
ncbi:phosphate/phosphite/phosphonate ABC transporter substrate-binding protein [Alkalihalobacillus pseudalcaliphilus]|uniref:phosphate/phosphite/phosphonate ABC transporter substrate-binding protein n=1 Tax=Alkalihalobacillus pseudalcaliphilus TaxID=79884 RepID=UPI00064DE727|nr:phosphate/phosphite/phosphonate ABC transporter substrate-binding protein [Alkalihalobacillus pseudalcaliphilus]KMK74734.1 phosphonate ABC transporter substrate-binding protein [Alkalihalobacillus pseudalcaliphilus]